LLSISLVICTYNRAELLPRCLVAALAQSLPREQYEVIVVDASSDHTRAIVSRLPEVRYVYCSSRGLSLARNKGAEVARSPIVAYIDDDAIAHPDLLRELLAVFDREPDAGCVGGRIELVMPARLPAWYSREFAGYYSEFNPGGDEVRAVTAVWEYPYGANVAFRKEALERAGGFSQRLGSVGANQWGGEELDMEFRVARLGDRIFYNPRARVEHVILPQRLAWSHIVKTAKAAGRNWAYFELELSMAPAQLREDIATLMKALGRVRRGEQLYFSRSQVVFFGAKILRKIRYRLRGFPAAAA
jgi:glycosyltransferase involved in cell wall biosynthesis